MIQFPSILKGIYDPKKVKNPALFYIRSEVFRCINKNEEAIYVLMWKVFKKYYWVGAQRTEKIVFYHLFPKMEDIHKEALGKYKSVGKQGRQEQRWEWDLCYFILIFEHVTVLPIQEKPKLFWNKHWNEAI